MLAPPTTRSRAIAWWGVLLLVWFAGAFYALHYLDRGWVPHDEGTLAHSAERVLHGQVPHVDFDEIYTGGLSYLNAAAFRLLGTDLLSLRLVLFSAFLLWVPAVYYIATRLARPVVAGGVVVLAIAWSVPNYSAAMPSWYNLFLATFGTAALFRYMEIAGQGRERGEERAGRRWLLLAGVCGGLSCLVKITGLHFVAAVLLWLVMREQYLSRDSRGTAPVRGGSYSVMLTVGLVAFVVFLLALLGSRLGTVEVLHFVLPGAALAELLLYEEWARTPAGGSKRYREMLRLMLPFAVGVLLPVAVFLVPYMSASSLGSLVDGVFLKPMSRLEFAAVRPPGRYALLVALPLVVLLGLMPFARDRLRGLAGPAVAVTLTAWLVLAFNWSAYRTVWLALRLTVPVLVIAGVWFMTRTDAGRSLAAIYRQQLALLLSVAAICSLVQFPFSAPVYFFYVAPLAALAGLALLAVQERGPRLAALALLGFHVAFSAARVHPGFIYQMGLSFRLDAQTERLELDRGGILVSAADRDEYERLVALLESRSAGDYIYAAPDAPEVYFLTGRRNPTRTIFDFFDDAPYRGRRILGVLDARRVTAIAINREPDFSGPLPPDLVAGLIERFPASEIVGRFEVRWRP